MSSMDAFSIPCPVSVSVLATTAPHHCRRNPSAPDLVPAAGADKSESDVSASWRTPEASIGTYLAVRVAEPGIIGQLRPVLIFAM